MPPKQQRRNNNKKKKKKAAPAAVAGSRNATTTINDNVAASTALTQSPSVDVSPATSTAAPAAGKCRHGWPSDDGSPEYTAALKAFTFVSEHQETSHWLEIANNFLTIFLCRSTQPPLRCLPRLPSIVYFMAVTFSRKWLQLLRS